MPKSRSIHNQAKEVFDIDATTSTAKVMVEMVLSGVVKPEYGESQTL